TGNRQYRHLAQYFLIHAGQTSSGVYPVLILHHVTAEIEQSMVHSVHGLVLLRNGRSLKLPAVYFPGNPNSLELTASNQLKSCLIHALASDVGIWNGSHSPESPENRRSKYLRSIDSPSPWLIYSSHLLPNFLSLDAGNQYFPLHRAYVEQVGQHPSPN